VWNSAVARHLETLFLQHGAPLLLKRDNGSVFNQHAVNEVLASWRLIPLNRSAYYAPYNGAFEQGIRELKDEVCRLCPCRKVGTSGRSPCSWRWQPPNVITCPAAAFAGPIQRTSMDRNNGAVAGASGNVIRLLSGLVTAQRPYWKTG
jgi:hypothetical protein